MTPRRRWSTYPDNASAVMTAHWLLSSAMRSSNDIDWPVHSMMLTLRDLRGLPLRRIPSTVPWRTIFSSVTWRQTWPNHDNLQRFTVDRKKLLTSGEDIDCCHTYSFVVCSHMICQASACSICFRKPSASPDRPSKSSAHTLRFTKWKSKTVQ